MLKYDGSTISRYALEALSTDIPTNVIMEQYTGLKDKNGTEIYEGDIVKGRDGQSIVHWDSEWAMFYAENCPLYDEECSKFVEVIGNIHENVELLK